MGTQQKVTTLEGRTFLNYGEAFLALRAETEEELHIVFFDKIGAAKETFFISKGTQDEVTISRESLIVVLLSELWPSMALLHNHPNGNIPSDADFYVNGYVRELAHACEKRFLNHCVVGKQLHYMRDIQDVFDEPYG
jgi:DNA repair protein RadC